MNHTIVIVITYSHDQYNAIEVLRDADALLKGGQLAAKRVVQISPTKWHIHTRSA